MSDGSLRFEFQLAEKLHMTRARMLRVMPRAEFTYWQAHYALEGEMQQTALQYPSFSPAEVSEWVRQRHIVKEAAREARKGKGKETN